MSTTWGFAVSGAGMEMFAALDQGLKDVIFKVQLHNKQNGVLMATY